MRFTDKSALAAIRPGPAVAPGLRLRYSEGKAGKRRTGPGPHPRPGIGGGKPLFIGGQLIRQFDAFLHLFLSAADALHSRLAIPPEDQFALNRVLAGLGGPPAPGEVQIHLRSGASLPALCLFLLMHREHCPILLPDPAARARVRQFTHIVAHAMVPMAAGGDPLPAEAVAVRLTEAEVVLRPLVTYNEDGEVAAVLRDGAVNRLSGDPAGGPYKLALQPPGEVRLDRTGPLHPVIAHITWEDAPLPFLRP